MIKSETDSYQLHPEISSFLEFVWSGFFCEGGRGLYVVDEVSQSREQSIITVSGLHDQENRVWRNTPWYKSGPYHSKTVYVFNLCIFMKCVTTDPFMSPAFIIHWAIPAEWFNLFAFVWSLFLGSTPGLWGLRRGLRSGRCHMLTVFNVLVDI